MNQSEILAYIAAAGRAELEGLTAEIKKALKKFPKQPKSTRPAKPLTPSEQARSEAFAMFKEWFLKSIDDGGAGYPEFYFDGAQAGGLSLWIKKMEHRYRLRNNGATPTGYRLFETMCLMFQNLPPYWRDKVDFTTINGKFEVILQQIKKSIDDERKSDPLQQARELANARRAAGQ